MQDWLSRMEYKFRRYSIRNLMGIVIFGMAFVFIIDLALMTGLLSAPVSLSSAIGFSWPLIREGQVWRLISFIFLPPNASLIFIIFALYFCWLIGSMLENSWGTFKFNIFYFCGVIGTIIGGIITGLAGNHYLNLSMFLAFSILYPNFEVRLFFMIPVKIKYLAFLDLAFLLYGLLTASIDQRVAIAASLINIIIFFGGNLIGGIKAAYRRAKWKRDAGGWFR